MVVDDEPHVLGSLHDLFRKDYHVVTFTAATEALEALDRPESGRGPDRPADARDERA